MQIIKREKGITININGIEAIGCIIVILLAIMTIAVNGLPKI